MKISKYYIKHQDFKFDFMWTDQADHRRELIFTVPFREVSFGFDW